MSDASFNAGRTRAALFYIFIPATALSHFDPARFPLSEPLRHFGPNFGFQPGDTVFLNERDGILEPRILAFIPQPSLVGSVL